MGLFFDQVPSQDQINMLVDAYSQQPPAADDLDTQVGQYLRQFGGAHVSTLTTALQSQVNPQQAEERARAALAHTTPQAPTKFHPWRFAIALLLFGALVGGGVAADASHLTAATAALFSFAGSIFGVVTAFLAVEKGS